MYSVPETLMYEAQLLKQGAIPKPRMAIIHNTYKCNQACNYCFFKDYRDPKTIPLNVMDKLLEDLEKFGVKSVQFCGGGEPLTAPDMDRVFDKATRCNLKSSLITNGVLLEGKVMESAIKNLSWIRVGLDTVDPELYKKTRGTDDCKLVVQNIKNALAYKKRIGSDCEISVKITLFGGNTLEHIQDVFNEFKGSGLSSIQIKHVWNEKGANYNEEITKDQIGKLNAYDNQVVRKIRYAKFMNEKCWISPVQVTVDARGDIFICCYYQGRDDDHRIGNIYQDKLENIWGSPSHRAKLEKIKISECLKHDCRFQKYMNCINKNIKSGYWFFL